MERSVEQVAVPKDRRLEVLETAHEGSLGGHLGIDNTREKILNTYFLPELYADVMKFCRSCPVCQKVARRRKGN